MTPVKVFSNLENLNIFCNNYSYFYIFSFLSLHIQLFLKKVFLHYNLDRKNVYPSYFINYKHLKIIQKTYFDWHIVFISLETQQWEVSDHKTIRISFGPI